MGLIEQINAEHAAADPHGLKGAGVNSAKHAFVNDPYVHQDFPAVVYRDVPAEQKTVANAEDLKTALAEGWRETPAVATETAAVKKAEWKPKPPAGH